MGRFAINEFVSRGHLLPNLAGLSHVANTIYCAYPDACVSLIDITVKRWHAMNYIKLNSQVSASGQLSLDDISKLVDEKIELLICNRPDDEDEGQTPYDEIAKVAQVSGIETRLLAFSSYQIQNDDRDRLIEILKENKRTHLYCRSGARSKRLWRMANKIGRGGHEFILKD